jgi:uncharacterized protein YajQ (UPF0234 family)
LIGEFTLEHDNQVFLFRNFGTDSDQSLTGFVNVLSEGTASLFVKYNKEVLILAVENKFDLFTDNIRVYVEKDGISARVGNRGDLLRLLADRKQQVRDYIKSNRIRVTAKAPESIKPVVDYYNSLQQTLPE